MSQFISQTKIHLIRYFIHNISCAYAHCCICYTPAYISSLWKPYVVLWTISVVSKQLIKCDLLTGEVSHNLELLASCTYWNGQIEIKQQITHTVRNENNLRIVLILLLQPNVQIHECNVNRGPHIHYSYKWNVWYLSWKSKKIILMKNIKVFHWSSIGGWVALLRPVSMYEKNTIVEIK